MTGVQTCALPIYKLLLADLRAKRGRTKEGRSSYGGLAHAGYSVCYLRTWVSAVATVEEEESAHLSHNGEAQDRPYTWDLPQEGKHDRKEVPGVAVSSSRGSWGAGTDPKRFRNPTVSMIIPMNGYLTNTSTIPARKQNAAAQGASTLPSSRSRPRDDALPRSLFFLAKK